MVDYITASRTKDHFQEQLLTEHPEIVSIAPQEKLDDAGKATGEAIIVIGVQVRPIIGPGGRAVHSPEPIPDKLPIISTAGKMSLTETVEVVIEKEDPIMAQSNTAKRRPCPGGYSIGHPSITAGTLGGTGYLGNEFGYIISNNHVLAASNSGSIGDPTYQPGPIDGGTSRDIIGHLFRYVPINFDGTTPNQVDGAVSKALAPVYNYVSPVVKDIGEATAVEEATVNQRVRKSGRTTQLTRGNIKSTNATIRVNYGVGVALFDQQLQYTHMTQGGDSGSWVWDDSRLVVVGLHFAGSSTRSYGNRMSLVLEQLSEARTVFDLYGKPSSWQREEISIVSE